LYASVCSYRQQVGLLGQRPVNLAPPPGLLDRANGFAARGAPSTIAPKN